MGGKDAIQYDWIANAGQEKIGGPDLVVEIDESKFGKRKYHHGHRAEGVWVAGGFCRETRDIFAVAVEDRTAETLINIIERYVEPGTIIYTDCRKGYKPGNLRPLGYLHGTVNHKKGFVNKRTGVHTYTIQGTWRRIKWKTPPSGRTKDRVTHHL